MNYTSGSGICAQGVKMKEIAGWADMAPSVMSSLYTTILPAYFDALQTQTPDEALDQALELVNNLSRRKLLNNLKEMIRRLNELEPDDNQRESERTFMAGL